MDDEHAEVMMDNNQIYGCKHFPEKQWLYPVPILLHHSEIQCKCYPYLQSQ